MVASADPRLAEDLARQLPDLQLVWRSNPESVLRDSLQSAPDAVVLADDLPGVDLVELLGVLRARSQLAHTSWLILASEELALRCARGGADTVLPRDIASTELLAAQLRNALNRTERRRQLEQQLSSLRSELAEMQSADASRDQLMHMLVHDLKNPITAVLGLLEMALEDNKDLGSDLVQLVTMAREEAQLVLSLSTNLLDVRKMQAGRMHLSPRPLDSIEIQRLLALAQSDVGVGLRERRLDLEIEELPEFQADPEILRRILTNLLSNAVKHTYPGGSIRIHARAGADSVLFSCIDDGEGILAEDLPRLFSAFEQSRLTLHSRLDTGLGLAFCRLAIEQHGGRIWVESTRWQGARFHFSLPLPAEDEVEADLLA